jgi:hypothetical protein
MICEIGSSTVKRAKLWRSSSDPIWRRRIASPDSSSVCKEVKCRLRTKLDSIKPSYVRACSESNSFYGKIRSGRGLFSAFAALPWVD